MGKITLDVVLKIIEVISNVAVVIHDSVKGRKSNDSSGSSSQKK